jgi:hypothetical protein
VSYKRPFLRNAQRRAALRASTAAACTTAAVGVFGVGTAAATPRFGLADDWFPQYADSGQADNPAFNTLKANLPLTDIRLVVPWNALGENHTASGQTTCQTDNVTDGNDYIHPSGGTMTSAIQSFLGKAAQDGLNVTVDFGQAAPDGSGNTPTLTDSNYKCGVEEFVGLTDSWGDTVHSWEPLNEPAAFIGDGATASNYYADLTAAVGLEASADGVSHSGDAYAAGVFGTGTSDAYVNAYVAQLKSRGIYPSAWAFHPYVDFTSWLEGDGSFTQTLDRINAINSENAGSYFPEMWIDEAGFNADASPPSDTAANMYSVGQEFLAMSQNVSGQITREYWSEFQNRQSSIDSAMYDQANTDLRGQYCSLARLPLSSCPAGF